MFSSWNFPTPMLGTLCLLMIPHINLYLMIHVVLYFWNCLNVWVAIGITYSPLSFLPWFCFTHLGLVFKLRWNIILLGLLEALFHPYYNMLFEDCNDSCDALCCTKEKLKKNCNTFTIILNISIQYWFRFFCWLK
jgi:hypothetical protein